MQLKHSIGFVLCAVAICWWIADSAGQGRTADRPSEATTVSATPAARRGDGAERASADRIDPARNTVAASTSAPKSRSAEFASATDLASFVYGQSGAVSVGDGDAAWWTEKAYAECSSMSISSNYVEGFRGYAMTLPEPRRTAVLRHLETVSARCRSLAATRINASTLASMAAIAREQGSLAAKAARLGADADNLSPEDVKARMAAIASSKDGEAIGEMTDSICLDNSERRELYAPFCDATADYVAWHLVGCALGRDCGTNGYVMRHMCMNLNQCFAGSYQDFLRDEVATPSQFAEALQKQRQILDSINRGAVAGQFP